MSLYFVDRRLLVFLQILVVIFQRVHNFFALLQTFVETLQLGVQSLPERLVSLCEGDDGVQAMLLLLFLTSSANDFEVFKANHSFLFAVQLAKLSFKGVALLELTSLLLGLLVAELRVGLLR